MTITGGVPISGFKLYAIDSSNIVTLVFDGTDQPAVLEATVTGLTIDKDYQFYVTALNPLEGIASDPAQFRLAGFPSAPGAITEVPVSRTGTSIGL